MNNNRRITLMRPSQMFESFMDEFFNSPISVSETQVSMYEEEDNLIVTFKAPGFKKEDLNISIQDDLLTVSGNIKEENIEEEKKRKYHIKEIKEESFSRTVSLPVKVDSDNTKASFEDGIVKISMPKSPEAKPKTISFN